MNMDKEWDNHHPRTFLISSPLGGLETWSPSKNQGSSLELKNEEKNEHWNDPKVYSIIFAQNLRFLDRAMDKELSLDLIMHFKETFMNNLYSPKVYSIIITQNPRVLDICVNEDSSLDFMNVYYDKQSNETTQLNPWVYIIKSRCNPRDYWVWEVNPISFIVGPMGQREEKKIEKTRFWARRCMPTKRWRMPTWRWRTRLGQQGMQQNNKVWESRYLN